MISADDAIKKTRNKGTGRLPYLVFFYKKHLQNLKYNVPNRHACLFHLILLGIPFSLVLPVMNTAEG